MVKSRYSRMSGMELIAYLKKFYQAQVLGQKGSHIKIIISTGKKTVVPNHKELEYGTFSAILEQLCVHEDDFLSKIR